MKLLDGLIVKSGIRINYKSHPFAQAHGITELIVNLNNPNKLFKLSKHHTVISSVKPMTYQRYYKTFKPIPLGGLTLKLKKLKEILNTPLPRSGINLQGFLISGPPGCGKTSMIKKAATNEFLILTAQCSELLRPHPGETEKVLQDLFKKAKLHAQEGKTLLILENIDLIGKIIQ